MQRHNLSAAESGITSCSWLRWRVDDSLVWRADLALNLTAPAAEASLAHAAVRVATGGAVVAPGKTSGYKSREEKEEEH